MRIVIPTLGSRGDVQPYVALGQGFARRAIKCASPRIQILSISSANTASTSSRSRPKVNRCSVKGRATGWSIPAPTCSPTREYVSLRQPHLHRMMGNCLEACRDAELILLTNAELFIGQSVAEKLGIPTCWTCLQPVTPSCYLANFLFATCPDWVPCSSIYNMASHAVFSNLVWQFLRTDLNRARRDILGLPALGVLGPASEFLWPTFCLHGYSEHVVPKPKDWGAEHHLTGYWFLDAPRTWQPPAELEAFLEAGPAPVYIGFGSMHNRDPEVATTLVLRALARAGKRGVLFCGWSGLRPRAGADNVYFLESAPHDWLFPRMAAIVHHGGAGTTAAALRAGKPSFVVPYMSDQPFWASRLFDLGVAPHAVPHNQLTADSLARDHQRHRRLEHPGYGPRAWNGDPERKRR